MDSTTNLETISASQASKEVTANALIDALSPSAYGGRHAEACTGLTFGYYGGRWGGSTVANGAISLGASTTTYVVAHRTTGAISSATATTNWDDTTTYARLYKIVSGASSVTSYEDHRTGPGGLLSAGSGSGTVTSVAVSVPAFLSVAGSPVTASGTIAITYSGTALPVANGGTGATSASAARTALGVAIGSDVQAYSAKLADLAGITYAQGDILYYNGTNVVKLAAGTSGQFLKTLGAGANPAWATASAPAKRIATPSWSSSMTLDWDSYDVYRITLGGSTTFTFSGGTDGQNCAVELTQDGTGSRTVTWPASARFSTDLPSPTLSTAASKLDKVGFQLNSVASKYDCVAVVRGY
jgi:hypothetical protein